MKPIWIAPLVILMAGCATPRYTPPTTYAVEPVIDIQAQGQPSNTALAVRPLDAARPYREGIVYREEGLVLGSYDYNKWAELPRDVVTRALIDALAATGRFSDVGLAAFISRPELTLTGQLRRFDEVRTTDPWTAEVEVSLALRESLLPEILWSDTIKVSVPLARNDVTALPQAMSEAVSQVAEQAAIAIAATANR